MPHRSIVSLLEIVEKHLADLENTSPESVKPAERKWLTRRRSPPASK